MEFGNAVDAGRVGRLALRAGRVAERAAENIVGGYVDEGAVVGLDGAGEVAYGAGIERFGEVAVVFGLVDVGISGTIDDNPDAVAGHHLLHGLGVGNVEVGDVGKKIIVVGVAGGVAQAAAQLAVGSGNENVHGFAMLMGTKMACQYSNGESKSLRSG